MKKKKLLIGTDNYPPRWDGIARFLHELLPNLRPEYEITVLAPKFKDKTHEDKDGIKVVRLKTFSFQVGDFTPAKFHFRKIKNQVKKADIVWIQDLGPIGALTLLYAKKYKKKTLAYIHSIEWELVPRSLSRYNPFKVITYLSTRILTKYLYNKCDLIMVPYAEVGQLFAWRGINVRKVIVPLGVDTSKFEPVIFKAPLKKALGLDPMTKVIGFCGRVAREKDLKTLFRAFIWVRKKFKNTSLVIIGKGVESITEVVKDRPNVKLIDSTDDVVPYLQAMDIFVLPSLTETSSLATMEAMSSGVAVVTTPVGYLKTYIKDGENGLLFPFKEPYILYRKLYVLLSNEDLMKKLGNNARETITSKFTWESTVEKVKRVLRKV